MIFLLFIIAASSSFIKITNPGFETNCYPLDGTRTRGHVCWEDPTGWARYHNTRHTILGHINPIGDPQFMNGNGASEGIQSLFVSVPPKALKFSQGEFGIEQRLYTTVVAETVYKLTVDIGNPKIWGNEFHKGWPGARIYLLAGNNILGEKEILQLEDGCWTVGVLTVEIYSNNPYIGHPLGIRLTNMNQKDVDANPSLHEVLFDNVKLEAHKITKTTYTYTGCSYDLVLILIYIQCIIIAIVIGQICWSHRCNMTTLVLSVYRYEDQMMKYIHSIYERFLYASLYQYNRRAPVRIYKLNMQYNTRQCRVCFRKYKKIHGKKEDILYCGHKFHRKCLRKWELQQFKQNAFKLYRCPICRTPYHWKQKWHYVPLLN